MTCTRRFPCRLAVIALAGLLTACASTPPASPPSAHFWRGRLALRIQTAEPTSYFASFELSGQPLRGELRLSTPLGTTLAHLRWAPGMALLQSSDGTRSFATLDDLATEATGTAIPIAALFLWLQGSAAEAHGWQADLSRMEEGRLLARRLSPTPEAELRLILDQP